jgi:UDP-N-acetylmuramoylalanine--D-glutamate ligase
MLVMREVKNKNITVFGAARSGIAAAKLLKTMGASVFISDSAPEDHKQSELETLRKLDIRYEFGGHSDKVYTADLAVLSPGIPKTIAVIQKMNTLNIPVYSELEVAFWYCKSPVIAITGSNGKTTTTTLLGEMLRVQMPNAIVAGNIGDAFSEYVLDSNQSEWAAVEVSSFQLETTDTFHPQIVVLLNLAPNHLDWYKSYDDYIDAKMLILRNLEPEDHLIYNGDDPILTKRVETCPAQKIAFAVGSNSAQAVLRENGIFLHNEFLINTPDIRLNGVHNYKNAMAAALAAHQAGIERDAICTVLSTFRGVEHRLEYVATIKGVNFINDSKATTIESLGVALTSFQSPIILIAGGKDKGSDYSKLNHLVAKNVQHAILIGSAKEKIASSWHDLIPVHKVDTLEMAIEQAFTLAQSGENVLLSPACSSFDMFSDYEDRGRKFKNSVLELKKRYEN